MLPCLTIWAGISENQSLDIFARRWPPVISYLKGVARICGECNDPRMKILNDLSSKSEQESMYVDFEDAVKKPWLNSYNRTPTIQEFLELEVRLHVPAETHSMKKMEANRERRGPASATCAAKRIKTEVWRSKRQHTISSSPV